jgi:RimJ/RimL family protein N-acetyltransferase
MDHSIFIEGKTVNLVPLTSSDAALCADWLNDMDTIVMLGSRPMPTSPEKEQESIARLYSNENSLILGVQCKEDGQLIGTGGLCRIEWINQRAELTICIGEKERRGKGYGTEASLLVLRHAFTKLNLHSVMLRTISYNRAGIRCYEKCGFKLIGQRREAKVIDGKYHDVLFMDILAREFLALHPS